MVVQTKEVSVDKERSEMVVKNGAGLLIMIKTQLIAFLREYWDILLGLMMTCLKLIQKLPATNLMLTHGADLWFRKEEVQFRNTWMQ